MRTTSLVILFLLVSLWRDSSFANGDQVAWRWRNDDGNVYTATWKDSVNTPVVLTQGENIRLRLEDLVSNASSTRMTLHYSEDPFRGVWFPVTGLDTGKFFISPSTYLTDGMSYGDNQLLPPDNPGNVYRRTIAFDTSSAFVLTTETSSIYEVEYSIMPTAHITPGSAYFFSTFLDSALMGGWEYAVLLAAPVHWRPRSVGTWCSFNGVAFADAHTGFAVGNGYSGGLIFKTADGGKTWISQPSPPSETLTAVGFADASVGIAVGSTGTILRTTDGGQTWLFLKNAGTNRMLSGVAFADKDTGAIVGFSDNNGTIRGLIWRTTNAGGTWTEQQGPSGRRLYAVAFASVDVGSAVGEAGTMMRTTDGGRSWLSRSSGATNDLRSISFGSINNGVAVGGGWGPDEGVTIRTTDGGANWVPSPNAGATGLYGVSFANASDGWTVGAGGWISKTTDGGASWQRLTSGAYRNLYAVDFVDREVGWAVGESGMILSTTDGGATSVDPGQAEGVPTEVALLQNYPNPFNPTTKIQFTIVNREWTSLTVFDVLGREVTTLVNDERQPGTYVVKFDGSKLASGVYLYRLIAGDVSQTRRMMIVK
jgi:photosystem II stability/assembly factor-like uncharacterized protein